MTKNFTIIGAGNGGQSLAGDLTLRGFKVSAIYDKNPEPIKEIQDRGGIKMSGPVLEGFAPIEGATTDIRKAIESADVIFVAITSNYHKNLASDMAPFVRADQTILIMPGYIGGSILFQNTFLKKGVKELPLVGESLSFPYATRLIEPAHAGIKAKKVALPIAALPSSRNQEFLEIIQKAIPEVVLFPDSLSVGFNCTNPVSHVPYYLFNIGKVEAPTETEADFHSWGTKTTNRIKEELDNERVSVGKALGLKMLSHKEIHDVMYHGKSYKPLEQKGDKLSSNAVQAPDRFVDEDVPMGLVAISSFAKMINMPTPTTDMLINITNFIRQKEFEKEGRTLHYLGMDNVNKDEVLQLIK